MTATRAALCGAQQGAGDPAWTNVVQLAHFFGANGSTVLTNSATGRGNTLAVAGSSISTALFKWNSSSLHCGATFYAQSAGVADYNFGTGDFTIEFWLNPLSLNTDGTAKVYIDFRDMSNTSALVPTISAPDSLGSIVYVNQNTNRITSATGVITAGAWQHVAASRVSNTTRLFVNGTQVGSNYSDSNTYITPGKLTVNCRSSGNAGATNCNYQDLRITNGTGRYSSNFSVPSGPFPNF
jgi:Concanavalin A-like lectin/glucanases superfamily